MGSKSHPEDLAWVQKFKRLLTKESEKSPASCTSSPREASAGAIASSSATSQHHEEATETKSEDGPHMTKLSLTFQQGEYLSFDDMKSGLNRVKNGKHGLVGLCNLGNTCFMNASIQCLSNTLPLSQYFLQFAWQEEINKKNPLSSQGRLAHAFADLIRQLWNGSDVIISPKPFLSEMRNVAHQFEGNEQHDAQEMLSFLLDGLHEDLNRVSTKKYIEDVEAGSDIDTHESLSAEAWRRYLTRNKSIIVDLFQGQLRSSLTCQKCLHVSVKFDPFMYLSLPVVSNKGGSLSLEDCLRSFTEPETLVGDNAWFCPICKTHGKATKKIELWKLPPILIVHLKRFAVDRKGAKRKLDDNIRFPQTNLELVNFVNSPQKDLPVYDLYGVCHHHGSMHGGHYTASCRNQLSGLWYAYDDSNCTSLDFGRELDGSGPHNRSAYVLFYTRVMLNPKGKIQYRRQSISLPHLWPHLTSHPRPAHEEEATKADNSSMPK